MAGKIREAGTHEPLAGATLVVTGGDGAEQNAISDENGSFSIELVRGQRKLQVYYEDGMLERPLTECNQRFVLEVELSGSYVPILVR